MLSQVTVPLSWALQPLEPQAEVNLLLVRITHTAKFCHSNPKLTKQDLRGTAVEAQRSRALAALLEDPGLVPSPHMVAHNHP